VILIKELNQNLSLVYFLQFMKNSHKSD